MEKLKKCSKCGRELPVSEFWKNGNIGYLNYKSNEIRRISNPVVSGSS